MDPKRVKVYVPVILTVRTDDEGEENFELELQDGSVSTELDIIETDAINAYESGDYMSLEEGE